MESALAVYYVPDIPDGVDYASYHTLETLQAMVEHRPGGETGVQAVQVLEGDAVWSAADAGRWSPELLVAAIGTVPRLDGSLRKRIGEAADGSKRTELLRQADPNPVVTLVEYSGGFRGAAYLTRALLEDEFCFAARPANAPNPVATWCHLPKPQRDHSSFPANHVEVMFCTGKPSYPVDRTYLVTGILAAAADSRFSGHQRVETPHLQGLAYTPAPEKAYGSARRSDTANAGVRSRVRPRPIL